MQQNIIGLPDLGIPCSQIRPTLVLRATHGSVTIGCHTCRF